MLVRAENIVKFDLGGSTEEMRGDESLSEREFRQKTFASLGGYELRASAAKRRALSN